MYPYKVLSQTHLCVWVCLSEIFGVVSIFEYYLSHYLAFYRFSTLEIQYLMSDRTIRSKTCLDYKALQNSGKKV